MMDLLLADRLVKLSRREGVWRGALIGAAVGMLLGTAVTVLVIRGALG